MSITLKQSRLSLLSTVTTKLAMDFGTTRKTLQLLKDLNIPVKRPRWVKGTSGEFHLEYSGPRSGLGVLKGTLNVYRNAPAGGGSPRLVLLHEAGHALDKTQIPIHFKIGDLEQNFSKVSGSPFVKARLQKSMNKLKVINEARADGTAIQLIRKFSTNPREAERVYKVKREAGKNSYIAGIPDVREALELSGQKRWGRAVDPVYNKILQRQIDSPAATNTTKANKELYERVLNRVAPPVPIILGPNP